ncbi:cytochrome P450 family 76 subfamily C polypeptide 7 [Citrus sinensis]|uniref:Cytochrome P450 n=1 Tax=Citrus clementina TaxID=85681 RepID=V4SIS8_CITCL|nr:geraniol 8-hydroxylase [Citrus x clementina]XP_006487469.2 geraniol 8-hydroxylase-like [Citrus sinensis]ESR36951.1 hypothetical protein CICLE_v10028239mg [Citrus x clementina]KAH9657633.1 cytochrome P450 family 76 subfamily C polypeptide 7 [Citrus sinensis]
MDVLSCILSLTKMDMLSCIIWLLFTCVFVMALSSFSRGRKKPLPPGPTPYPVIGNLLELGEKPHKSLAELAKIYGPILSLKLGEVTTVVVSSAPMAKYILQDHDSSFYNRMVKDAIFPHQHNEFGMVILPVSTTWKNLRKLCNLHIFTTQKLDANQELRRKKIKNLLSYVEENCRAGKAIDISQVVFNTSLNLLSNTIFSVDLADDTTERKFKDTVSSILVEIGKPNLSDHFPLLKRLDLQGIRSRMTFYFGKMLEVFDGLIDQRLKQRQQHDYNSTSIESKDVLGTLLDIIQDKSVEIDRNYIKHLFLDLFVAGTDTTSSTLEWAMAELLRSPDALSKARLELEQTIGKGKTIEESDITRLPYLQAVVKETLRLHPAVPLLLPRKALADVEIAGFIVPKGAQVFVNAWAIGRDELTWENPLSFMPERFLGSNLDFKGRNFELIPFGSGRRICPGLPLAIRMLHLMLGSLINSFDWKLEDENMDMEEKFGITLQKAQPLRVIPVAI